MATPATEATSVSRTPVVSTRDRTDGSDPAVTTATARGAAPGRRARDSYAPAYADELPDTQRQRRRIVEDNMASLIVNQVHTVLESDEIGSDDVYMVVFRGNIKEPYDSNIGVHAPDYWRNRDSGDIADTDRPIAAFVQGAVYVVMLVEQDHGRDISGDAVIGAFKYQTNLTWKASMFAGATPAAAAQAVIDTMNGLASIFMEFPKGNDDVLGVQRVIAAPGVPGVNLFKGDGGIYAVWFKVA
jgi:hypothetical protein